MLEAFAILCVFFILLAFQGIIRDRLRHRNISQKTMETEDKV